MQDDLRFHDVEDLLARYRPLSPPPELRERVANTRVVAFPRLLALLPLAAGLVVAALLQLAAWSIDAHTARLLSQESDAALRAKVDAVLSVAPLSRSYVAWRLTPPPPSGFTPSTVNEGS